MKPLKTVVRETILEELVRCGGNKTHTARNLQIGVRTLQRHVHRYRAEGYMVGIDAKFGVTIGRPREVTLVSIGK